MRHSKIDLTMNCYTDPTLLDVSGALDALPTLSLTTSSNLTAEPITLTGTDGTDGFQLAPLLAPGTAQSGTSGATSVTLGKTDGISTVSQPETENSQKTNEKGPKSACDRGPDEGWITGFEPATSGITIRNDEVASDNRPEVMASEEPACTTACTSPPETDGETPSDSPIERDLTTALSMIERLPLSDEEKAETVRRLLAIQQNRS